MPEFRNSARCPTATVSSCTSRTLVLEANRRRPHRAVSAVTSSVTSTFPRGCSRRQETTWPCLADLPPANRSPPPNAIPTPSSQLLVTIPSLLGRAPWFRAVVTRDCFSGWVFALRVSHIVVCAVHYTGYTNPGYLVWGTCGRLFHGKATPSMTMRGCDEGDLGYLVRVQHEHCMSGLIK